MSDVPEGCPLHEYLPEQLTWRQRYPATYGFLIASVIFTVLLYALLIDQRNHELGQCERIENSGNSKVAETYAQNLARLVESPEVNDATGEIDCKQANPLPWPLG